MENRAKPQTFCTRARTNEHTSMHTHARACTNTHTHTLTHTHACTYTTQTHTRTHMHAHTYAGTQRTRHLNCFATVYTAHHNDKSYSAARYDTNRPSILPPTKSHTHTHTLLCIACLWYIYNCSDSQEALPREHLRSPFAAALCSLYCSVVRAVLRPCLCC